MASQVGKDINFLQAEKFLEKDKKKQKGKIKPVYAIPAFLLVIMLILNLAFAFQTRMINSKNNQMKSQIAATEAQQAKDGNDAQKKLAAWSKYKSTLESALNSSSAGTQVKKDMIDSVVKSAVPGISIKTMTYDGTGFSLDLSTKSNLEPAKFVQRLRKTKKFSQVQFSGYDKEKNGPFTFTMYLTLK